MALIAKTPNFQNKKSTIYSLKEKCLHHNLSNKILHFFLGIRILNYVSIDNVTSAVIFFMNKNKILRQNNIFFVSEDEENKKKVNPIFDLMLYINLPIVFILLYYFFNQIDSNVYSTSELIGLSLSAGILLATNAINVAHELGHNANKHVADKIQNANTGALLGLLVGIYVGLPQDMMEIGQSIGATAYSIEYENEADYLSMYILAQAGYNLDEAVDFWRRFAVEVPNSIYSTGGTHPSTAERYVRMESTIKEIKDKISKGEKLIPSYKKE